MRKGLDMMVIMTLLKKALLFQVKHEQKTNKARLVLELEKIRL